MRRRGEQPNLLEVIRRLERRVSDLESGNRIGNTAIDSGNLVVESGSSINIYHPSQSDWPIVRLGDISGHWGIAVTQVLPSRDGFQSTLFETGAPGPELDEVFTPIFTVFGVAGDSLMSLAPNWGLAEPRTVHNFLPTSNHITPAASTTSATFAQIFTVWGYTYHEGILIDYIVQNDVGTTSEVQIREANIDSVTATASHGSGAFEYGSLNFDFVSNASGDDPFPGMFFKVDLEIRRTSGAGVVRAGMISAIGF